MITLISPSQAAIDPGLRTISSYLKENGFPVKMVFLKKRFEQAIEQDVAGQIADIAKDSLVIGITLMTHEFFLCADLTRKLKELTQAPIVWGGPHAMVRPEECLEHCDYVCIGEGEHVFLSLINCVKNGRDPLAIAGMWTKRNGQIIKNPLAPLIEDLNSLPFPDYSFEEHYLLEDKKVKLVSEEQDRKQLINATYFLYSQRGCPFVCSYCINHFFLKRHKAKFHRSRNVDSIMRELRYVKDNFSSVVYICFDSDDFLSMKEDEIARFVSFYKEEIKLPFHVNATPRNLTEKKIGLLIEAGLRDVSMGIQSGSERTLKLYKRAIFKNDIVSATNILNKFYPKISANYDFILDNPWETEDDQLETLKLLNEIPRPYNILLYSLTLYPGTELYERAKNENLISDEIKGIYTKSYHTDISNTYFNSMFYLYATFRFPKWLGRILINKKLIYNPLFFGLKVLITYSLPVLKGMHFAKYVFKAILSKDMGLLKNYFKVAIREIKKGFVKNEKIKKSTAGISG
ncbi:MAG: B12-binding domain-containing radical SAM protein [Candidatus Omnitrophica bacterium]|nr:B12-binding domain-containing radical SAM protein [Candidatus Omnitrophota bacterium]